MEEHDHQSRRADSVLLALKFTTDAVYPKTWPTIDSILKVADKIDRYIVTGTLPDENN